MSMFSTKSWKYGAPIDPQSYNRMDYANKQKQFKNDIMVGVNERLDGANFAHGIGKDQRAWYDANIAPMEAGMSKSIQDRINPDQMQLRADTRKDILDAYSKASEIAKNKAARFGQTIDAADERAMNINATKSAVEGSNRVSDQSHDNAVNDAANFYNSGAGLPNLAANTYLSGSGSLADQYDYISGQELGKMQGKVAGDQAGMSSIASMFADGGEVKDPNKTQDDDKGLGPIKWLRKLATGREEQINGSINKNENDQLTALDSGKYADGGAVGLPKIREVNKDIELEMPKDGDSLKRFKQDIETRGIPSAPDNNVKLDSGDFIVPESAVKHYGRAYFDSLVSEHGGEPGFAAGGGIGFDTGVSVGRADSMNTGSSLASNVINGMKWGLQDAQQRELHDQQMKDHQEDRTYLSNQRDREAKLQAAQDEYAAFSKQADNALGSYISSGGSDYQNIVDLYNQHYGTKLNVQRDKDGGYVMSSIGPDGSVQQVPKKMSFDDFGQLMYAMKDPSLYMQMLQKQKGEWDVTSSDGTFLKYNKKSGQTEMINGPGHGGLPKGYNQQTAYSAIDKHLIESMGGAVDPMGNITKPPDNPDKFTQMRSLAQKMERENPGQLAPGELVSHVLGNEGKQWISQDDARKQAENEASDKAGWTSTDQTDFGMPRSDWVKQRTTQIQGQSNASQKAVGTPIPSGIPAGSKLIGTAKGKPVYQAPNGKRYIIN